TPGPIEPANTANTLPTGCAGRVERAPDPRPFPFTPPPRVLRGRPLLPNKLPRSQGELNGGRTSRLCGVRATTAGANGRGPAAAAASARRLPGAAGRSPRGPPGHRPPPF